MAQIAHVREFFGAGADFIALAPDGLGAAPNNACWAAIVNADTTTGDRGILSMGDRPAAIGGEWEFGRQATNQELIFYNEAAVLESASDLWANALGWVLVAVTKADGSSVARWHRYIYNTDTWDHQDDGAAGAEPVAGAGTIELVIGAFVDSAFDTWDGKIAVVGYGRDLGSLPSDGDIEGLQDSITAWDDAVFLNSVWLLNQDDEGTPVTDRKGNADQTDIGGTNAVAEAGLAFDVGGDVEPVFVAPFRLGRGSAW
jgi:hypothetical protein